MWIISTDGFLSVVEHRTDHSLVLVRARDKRHLENLLEYVPDQIETKRKYMPRTVTKVDKAIVDTTNSDYRYRITIPKRAMALAAQKMVLAVNYPNFKNAAAVRKGRTSQGFVNALHDVWDAFAKIQATKPWATKIWPTTWKRNGRTTRPVWTKPSNDLVCLDCGARMTHMHKAGCTFAGNVSKAQSISAAIQLSLPAELENDSLNECPACNVPSLTYTLDGVCPHCANDDAAREADLATDIEDFGDNGFEIGPKEEWE